MLNHSQDEKMKTPFTIDYILSLKNERCNNVEDKRKDVIGYHHHTCNHLQHAIHGKSLYKIII